MITQYMVSHLFGKFGTAQRNRLTWKSRMTERSGTAGRPAELESASREAGGKFHALFAVNQTCRKPAQQFAGGEPELAAAHFFTLRRHLGNSYMGLLRF